MHFAIWVWSDDGQGAAPPAADRTTHSSGSFSTAGAIMTQANLPSSELINGAAKNGATGSYSLTATDNIYSGNIQWEMIAYNYPPGGGYYIDTDYNSIAHGTETENPCYEATCTYSVAATFSNGQTMTDGSVEAGKPFKVSVTMYNAGGNTITDPMDPGHAYAISATEFNGGYFEHAMGQGDIGVNGQITSDPNDSSFTFNAPASLTPYSLNLYPDYWGRREINSNTNYRCSGPTITPYEPFTLTPTAISQPDAAAGATNENPSLIDYSTYVTNSATTQVNLPPGTVDISKVYYAPVSGGQVMHAGPVNSNSYAAGGPDYTISPGQWAPTGYTAGDKYCAEITLTYNGGYVNGGGGTIYDTTQATSGGTLIPLHALQCVTVTNEPYAHFFGSDANATLKGFGNSCAALPAGGIFAFNKANGGNYTGSGSQFGAGALGVIEGFGSGMLHGSSPANPAGLTFANGNVGLSGTDYGGKIGTGGDCAPDYYAGATASTVTQQPGTNITVGTNGAQSYADPSGNFTLNGGSVADGTHQTVYVKGNVYITAPITYADTNWTSISQIPSFDLVVSGNIYIAPNVGTLDGFYVAQPNAAGTGGGTIDTCATANGPYHITSDGSYFGSCNQQLVVNGAFLAQTVLLDRSLGSLRDSSAADRPAGSGKSCANGAATLNDCAAEVFNFSPELFLAGHSLQPLTGPTTGTYDKITSLSPVLHTGH